MCVYLSVRIYMCMCMCMYMYMCECIHVYVYCVYMMYVYLYRFTIDEATGQIMASQRLNAETQTVYRLNVEAVDRGGRSTSVPVTVHIEDVNDNRPTFRRDRYYGIIKENSPHFTRSIKVEVLTVCILKKQPQ